MLNILFLSILLSVLVVVAIKYYIKTNQFLYIIGIVLIDLLSIYVYIQLLSQPNSSLLYCIAKILTIMIVLLLSITLFEEEITLIQWTGILLACLSVVLIMK
jgi:multidrug transporter EmrE-like cation transporter